MNILIADTLPPLVSVALESLGCVVRIGASLKASEIADQIDGQEVLIVRSTRVEADVFERGTKLELVIRAGAGTNTIDLEAAGRHGVYVANCPGKNAVAVAELTWAMVLGLDRQVALADRQLRAGRWQKKRFSQAKGLYGRCFGIVGFGHIGREVAKRAQAMGMRVIAWSRSLTPDLAQSWGVECASSLEALAREADVVSVHLPKSEHTIKLLSENFFAHLKNEALLVNVSRGGIVDEKALLPFLEKTSIRYATDVFDKEPTSGDDEFNHPLCEHERSLCTPHIGAATLQAQESVAREVVRIVESYKKEGAVPNVVNLRPSSLAHCQVQIRHLDQVGVLAEILTHLRKADLNVEQMSNAGFAHGGAACASITVNSEPSPEVLQEIRKLPQVLGLSVRV
jgi:D-3-phosphoglycerate dehydrogenase / 2-oxoglutarate reductase